MNDFPTKKYKIIYADPPWQYDDKLKSDKVWGSAESHYDTMSLDELKQLPIQTICEEDSILFLWVTWPLLKEGLELIESWGFNYRTCAFVWVKTFNGRTHRGMGRWSRGNTEPVLLAKKGKPQRISKRVSQVFQSIEDFEYLPENIKSELKGHSKKPDMVRNKIIQLMGDIPRIELFARTKVHGWDVWGNDEKLDLQPLESYY